MGNSQSNPSGNGKTASLFVSIVALNLTCTSIAAAERKPLPSARDDIAVSIGRVVLAADEYRLRARDPEPLVVLQKIEAEYQKIKAHSSEDRLRYFWSIMNHVEFDGAYLHDFHKLASADCQDFIVDRLQGILAAKNIVASQRHWATKHMAIKGHPAGKCEADLKTRQRVLKSSEE